MIYTHTEQKNRYVLALNEKLVYHEVRRGPIWDESERASLSNSSNRLPKRRKRKTSSIFQPTTQQEYEQTTYVEPGPFTL